MNNIIGMLKLKVADMPEFARNPRNMGRFDEVNTTHLAGKTVTFNVESDDIDFPRETRTLDVKFVMSWNGKMYVHGYCHKHKAMRTYSAEKMCWQKNDEGKFVKFTVVEATQPVLF